jgi:hypothetical protein
VEKLTPPIQGEDMPKDTREIVGSVRLSKGRGVFDMEKLDEFEAAATAEEIASLTERRVIAGFDVNTKKAEKSDEKAEKAEKVLTGSQLSKLSRAKLLEVVEAEGLSTPPDTIGNKEIVEAILKNRELNESNSDDEEKGK